jgi:putative flavoprotein involved in K+ transport
VLVVGASATGVQIAEELAAAGREVTLSVGHHGRLPRQVFDEDICTWLERIGWLSQTIDNVGDARRARHEPRLQLVGRPGADLDLGVLADQGVRLVGRVAGATGSRLQLRDDLDASIATSQAQLDNVLRRIELAAGRRVGQADVRPIRVKPAAREVLDLRTEGITNVVWCTGQEPHYPWLDVPVLDRTGAIRQRRGVTDVPGLFVVGTRFQHRRDSTFLDGLRHDASHVVGHLIGARALARDYAVAA